MNKSKKNRNASQKKKGERKKKNRFIYEFKKN